MNLHEFAEMTRQVISYAGFAYFLPVAYFPDREQITVLEAVPGGDAETVALTWAADAAVGTEEYLVAFKADPRCCKVVRHANGRFEQATIDVASG